ncbi:MAG: alpha/beta hydrolase [Planctomycetes bacterium]|nr:alpha/beta hydrolase [Planctomycetota bacterium]
MRPVGRTLGFLLATITSAWSQDFAQPGPFVASRRDSTMVRSGGSSFVATVHYPATASAVGSPFDPAAGPCPVIAFGHGFLSAVTLYQSTASHLASWGFVVALPQTQGGLFPSHAALAADMVSTLDWLASQSGVSGSVWSGAIDGSRRGMMGHSMGAGCSMLAAASDPRVRAMVSMAPAETNPSSTQACASIRAAVRMLVGSQDAIVAPSTATPMFDNLLGDGQLVSIIGGFHCGFIDSSFIGCDSGSITRTQQLAIVRREATEFLLVELAGMEELRCQAWGQPGAGTVRAERPSADLDGDGTVSAADLAVVLLNFGECARGDLDDNGTVDGGDVALLLLALTA